MPCSNCHKTGHTKRNCKFGSLSASQKKKELKKELREIDRQLARFGVLIKNETHQASDAIEVALENMGIETMPFNTTSEKIQRNTKCKYMKEHLEKYGYYDNARAFDPNKVEPLLNAKTEYYTKCSSDNIYGKSIPQSPYLWPLIAIPPENFRYISINNFLDKVYNGTLTPDELFMFTLVHSINHASNNGDTALILASMNGHIEIVSMLLDRGADVNQVGNDGWTALMLACQNGLTNIAAMLIDRGADVNHSKNDGWTALMVASQHGQTEAARLLIERGAEVNHANNNRNTALLTASKYGQTETARLLIESGADVNHSKNDGMTALLLATRYQHPETVSMLLESGADANLTSNKGLSVQHYAIKSKNVEIQNMFL